MAQVLETGHMDSGDSIEDTTPNREYVYVFVSPHGIVGSMSSRDAERLEMRVYVESTKVLGNGSKRVI